jgi:hypothetical protein
MAKVSLVALVVLLVLLPFPLLAQPGRVEKAGTVEKLVLPSFSVSFAGTDSQEVRNAFLEYSQKQGQPVAVLDFGAKYQVCLNGYSAPKNVYGGLVRLLGRTTVHANLQDWETWTLSAEIRRGNQLLANEAVSTEGPRMDLRATTWSRQGGAYFGAANSWLSDNLRNRAVAEMTKQVFARLCELERLQLANQPRDPSGRVIPQQYRYVMLPQGSWAEIPIVLDRELAQGDQLAVIRAGRQVAVLTVQYFNQDKSKVWVSGDFQAALHKGCSFKAL